jgi:BolA protein
MAIIKKTMLEKLEQAFSPEFIDLIDESHKHSGHAGFNPEGESHFRLVMRSAVLSGRSRLEQHRMINKVLAEELGGRVHALAIEVL